MDTSLFFSALTYLAAAAIAAPLGKKLGLGAVLGYLVIGAVIGPSVLGWVGGEREEVMHFAEFGVVLMLFLIGLELDLTRLWRLRGPIFGLGGAQVGLSAVAIGGAAWAGGFVAGWQPAVAVGLALALSSTAIVIQTLRERGLSDTVAGTNGFAVLLFQDIAVIPILALLPLLAPVGAAAGADHAKTGAHAGDAAHASHGEGGHAVEAGWIEQFPAWGQALAVLGAVAVVILLGRYALTPWLRWAARSGVPEALTATALTLVVGVALLMNFVGLSPALGTFVAGVMLASSEYRHELEGDIEPFKGLLLAVFFLAVGAGLDFALLAAAPVKIALGVVGLITIKAAVLLLLARLGGFGFDQRLLFTAALAQGGEFAFVLFGFASQRGIVNAAVSQELIAVVVLSMALAPLLMIFTHRVLIPRLGTRMDAEAERPADTDLEHSKVLLAGFGRFGHPLARLLRSTGCMPTVLELDSDHVEFLRGIGLRCYYGDATRLPLLRAAGAEQAQLLIIAIDDEEACLSMVETCQKHFPGLTIFARACSRRHALQLHQLGVRYFIEQLGSSLHCARRTLEHLGRKSDEVEKIIARFQEHEFAALAAQADILHDEVAYANLARQHIADLDTLLANAPLPETGKLESDRG